MTLQSLKWRHNVKHNDAQHDDTQQNDSQHNGLICDTQHKRRCGGVLSPALLLPAILSHDIMSPVLENADNVASQNVLYK